MYINSSSHVCPRHMGTNCPADILRILLWEFVPDLHAEWMSSNKLRTGIYLWGKLVACLSTENVLRSAFEKSINSEITGKYPSKRRRRIRPRPAQGYSGGANN